MAVTVSCFGQVQPLSPARIPLPSEILSLIAQHCVDSYSIAVWLKGPQYYHIVGFPRVSHVACVSRDFHLGIRIGLRDQFTGWLHLDSDAAQYLRNLLERHDFSWFCNQVRRVSTHGGDLRWPDRWRSFGIGPLLDSSISQVKLFSKLKSIEVVVTGGGRGLNHDTIMWGDADDRLMAQANASWQMFGLKEGTAFSTSRTTTCRCTVRIFCCPHVEVLVDVSQEPLEILERREHEVPVLLPAIRDYIALEGGIEGPSFWIF